MMDYTKEHDSILPYTFALFDKESYSPGNGILLQHNKQPFILTNLHIIKKHEIKFGGSIFKNSIDIQFKDAKFQLKLGPGEEGAGDLCFLPILNDAQEIFQNFPNVYEIPFYKQDKMESLQLQVGELCLVHGYYGKAADVQSELFYQTIVSQSNLLEGRGQLIGVLPKGGSGSGIWKIEQGKPVLRGITAGTQRGYSVEGIDLKKMYKWTLEQLVEKFSQNIVEDSVHKNFVKCYDLKSICKSCQLVTFLK